MKNYVLINNPEMIREVQKVQLEILKKFDEVCKKNNLKYQVFGGTLLGAIRHKGFIPWDDDVDVAMLRKDYEKFLKIFNSENVEGYFLQTIDTDENTHFMYAKLKKEGTLYIEESIENKNIHQGIFIDIFPMDYVKHKEFKGIKLKLLSFVHRLHMVNSTKVDNKSFKLKMIKIFTNIFISKNMSLNMQKWIIKSAKNLGNENSIYVNHILNGSNKKRYEKFIIKKTDFLDMLETVFEDIKVPIPKNYDSYLKQIYGDYKKLPPKEEQIPHHQITKVKI